MAKTFEQLLNNFLLEEISPEDLPVFLAAARQPANEEAIKAELSRRLESKTYQSIADTRDLDSTFEQMLLKADRIMHNEAKIIDLYSPKKRFKFYQIAAAVFVMMMIGVGSYFLFFNKNAQQNEVSKIVPDKDIKAPVLNKAKITLADGRIVLLDSAIKGTLASQGNVQVIKTVDGKIIYNGMDAKIAFNTIDNPRGSKVQTLTLGDGTTVWLNAESSIRFPTTFIGKERKVYITGEAYFEVSKNASKPFVVSKGATNVQVLGTHFNVNAYEDDGDIRVTLIEGAVKVTNAQHVLILQPNQQAIITGSNILLDTKVNVEAVMGWKNNLFQFENTDIETMLTQFARWYDLLVVYKGNRTNRKFFAVMNRDLDLSKVLKILQANNISFSVEGKIITVK